MEALDLIKHRGAGQVLRVLFRFPGRQFTINELARTAKVPFSSTWRLVKKWEPAGVVETGRVGAAVTVRLRESAYARQLAKLMKLSISPQAFTANMLGKTLKKSAGVKEAFLFGSVARGEEKLESDIDLAILAGKGYDADKLVFDTYSRHGTKIVPLVFNDKKELERFLRDKKKVRLA